MPLAPVNIYMFDYDFFQFLRLFKVRLTGQYGDIWDLIENKHYHNPPALTGDRKNSLCLGAVHLARDSEFAFIRPYRFHPCSSCIHLDSLVIDSFTIHSA